MTDTEQTSHRLSRPVSLPAAAAYAGVSLSTIRRRIADGTLPAYELGPRMRRIDLDDVDAMFERVPVAVAPSAVMNAPAERETSCASSLRHRIVPLLDPADMEQAETAVRGFRKAVDGWHLLAPGQFAFSQNSRMVHTVMCPSMTRLLESAEEMLERATGNDEQLKNDTLELFRGGYTPSLPTLISEHAAALVIEQDEHRRCQICSPRPRATTRTV